MSILVNTISSEFKSAQNLGFKTFKGLPEYPDFYDKDVIIRWGNSDLNYNSQDKRVEYKNTINTSEAIARNCKNKRESLELYSTVVNTPKIYKKNIKVPAGQRVVYRPTNHTGGEGFSIKEGPFIVEPYFYATQFIDTDNEMRVWVCGDGNNYRVLTAKRVYIGESAEEAKSKCRSTWGYRFIRSISELSQMAIKAAQIMKIQAGAGDFLEKDGKFYLLEFNTAPSPDCPRIVRFFQRNLMSLIRDKFPNLQYDTPNRDYFDNYYKNIE